MNKTVTVKNEPPAEVPTEVLAKAIVDIAAGAQKILNGSLKKRAVFVLIRDALNQRVGIGDIQAVLEAAAELKMRYVK